MQVTYFGTTMLLFDDGKDQILFDCHVTRPSLIQCLLKGLSTDKKTADRVIKDGRIQRLRAIFISHSHHDHVMDAPYFAKKCSADIYGSPSVINVAKGGDLKEEQLHAYRDGCVYQIGEFQISVIPSLHSKAHWYNNDLGEVIEQPLVQPARKKAFKEGGSFDFIVEHQGKVYIIRPSYNYVEGQWDGKKADVLFLGIGGLSKDAKDRKEQFFKETIEKLRPSLVIPVHYDNFFVPLYGPIRGMPKLMEDTGKSIYELSSCCIRKNISCVVLPPLGRIEF